MGSFFGMILTSVFYIWSDLPKYSSKEYLGSVLGLLFGLTLLWVNPGTENEVFASLLEKKGIETENACTLVLLSTKQY